MTQSELVYRQTLRKYLSVTNRRLKRLGKKRVDIRHITDDSYSFRRLLRYQRRRISFRYSRFSVLQQGLACLMIAFILHRRHKHTLFWKPASDDVSAELSQIVLFDDLFSRLLNISRRAVYSKCDNLDYNLLRILRKESRTSAFESAIWKLFLDDTMKHLLLFVSITIKL